eukprot:16170913-Heterocapsa_arctica.AAC.1
MGRRFPPSQAGTRPHRSSSGSSIAFTPEGGTSLTTACCASGSWGRASCIVASSESAVTCGTFRARRHRLAPSWTPRTPRRPWRTTVRRPCPGH